MVMMMIIITMNIMMMMEMIGGDKGDDHQFFSQRPSATNPWNQSSVKDCSTIHVVGGGRVYLVNPIVLYWEILTWTALVAEFDNKNTKIRFHISSGGLFQTAVKGEGGFYLVSGQPYYTGRH